MEGIGSRMGRVSSRYGASPAATVFNGPVRKWRRQWVTSVPTGDNAPANNNGRKRHQKRDAIRPLLLCRWTPSTSTASDMLPPNRKFRYTPVIVLDQVKKEACAEVVDDLKLSTVCPSEANMTVRSDNSFQDSKFSDSFPEDMKETRKERLPVNQCHLDLQLHFKN